MEHAACVEHLIEVGHLLQNHTNTLTLLVECARSQIRCYLSTESLIYLVPDADLLCSIDINDFNKCHVPPIVKKST